MASVEQYRGLAAAAAGKWSDQLGVEVPVDLVLAVMKQENPRAVPDLVVVEPGGHRSFGLMSVKDTTAAGYGYLDPTALFDPATGVDVGTHYLAEQLKRYGGDPVRAVAAYNAGSARYTEAEQFVNQSYVDRVLSFYRQLVTKTGPIAVPAIAVLAGVALFLALARARRSRGGSRATD